MSEPLRVVLAGAGGMGMQWLDLVTRSPHTEPVAVVDLDVAGARERLDRAGLRAGRLSDDLNDVLAREQVDLLVNTTIPAAHHDVSRAAMESGAHVVSEKPAAASLADGLRLASVAHTTGRMLSISQSRRLTAGVRSLASAARAAGGAGALSCQFARGPRFGGFRDRMDHPLLLDMAIHPFDTARALTGSQPVAVRCRESNPPWSWYDGAAQAAAIFEMSGGVTFSYTGSWCSLGAPTSWNGDWRVETSAGVLRWDGEGEPTREDEQTTTVLEPVGTGREGIAAGFDEMLRAILGGPEPDGAVLRNLGSMAMVEAAVVSSRTGREVHLPAVYEAALQEATAAERDPAVHSMLEHVARQAQSEEMSAPVSG